MHEHVGHRVASLRWTTASFTAGLESSTNLIQLLQHALGLVRLEGLFMALRSFAHMLPIH